MAKGYRVLARRASTPQGEIDLVVRTRKRVSFVEVKARPSFEEAEAAIGLRQSARVHRAAEAWIAGRPVFMISSGRSTIVFVVPWSWPGITSTRFSGSPGCDRPCRMGP